MKRVLCAERPNWKQRADELGFVFHTMYGAKYWDETRYYEFTMNQIEQDFEGPSTELHMMCLAFVDEAVRSEAVMSKLQIPEPLWDVVAESWFSGQRGLYGRFDLAYNGVGPAKLLEYNADTPTSLYESSYFQWVWLEDMIAQGSLPKAADQFNRIQEALIDRFKDMFEPSCNLHFASCSGVVEDRETVRYLEDCATQVGLNTHHVCVEEIGLDAIGRFVDHNSNVIEHLFKLYPLEDMMREDYSLALIKNSNAMIEPLWKSVLSNKALLPYLWKMFPNHPNLLAAYFDEDGKPPAVLGGSYVKKPLFSREGANIEVCIEGRNPVISDGLYGAEGHVYQAYVELPQFGDDHAVVGSWIVGDESVGIGIREDKEIVTKDLSRFIPHIILD